jgi:uncharacterized protein YdaU (DUF1376 family)
MGFNGLWWWIDRWRKSTAYTDFSLEEQGAYRNLIDEANLRGGAIPNDETTLAKACGDPRRWKKLRAKLLSRFNLTAEGWRHETLDQVLAKGQEVQARRADAGRNGARTRWQTHSKPIANGMANSMANPMAKGMANDMANAVANPSHLFRRESDQITDPAYEEQGGSGGEAEPVDPALEARANRFMASYAQLYAQYRHGARYYGRRASDFDAALELVAHWADDARLETLAVAFLTTDDPYCRGGSGSISHFGSRASWCDGKLKAAGL